MIVKFTKIKINNKTEELRKLIRYTLTFALNRLPFGQLLKEKDLEAEAHVFLVSPDTIQEMNRDTRGQDRVTDILSYPMLDMKDGELLEPLSAADLSYDSEGKGQVFLGDLVLCLDRAEEQALDYGHAWYREISFLILHGLLHVLGYDHMIVEEERQMIALQKDLMEYLGISRSLDNQEIIKQIRR